MTLQECEYVRFSDAKMSTEDQLLLEIDPQEIRLVLEHEKPISHSIRINNKSDYHVAFKVKTTSATEHYVKPNAGIIKPHLTTSITVAFQSGTHGEEKLLVQSKIVPDGTKEEHIASETTFNQEKELKVVLLGPSCREQTKHASFLQKRTLSHLTMHICNENERIEAHNGITFYSDVALSGHAAHAILGVVKTVAQDINFQTDAMDMSILEAVSKGELDEQVKRLIHKRWEVLLSCVIICN
ncbi:vesicle-associated membrane-protein-associated protein [Artemisia annua]|uniref:Vesicle-associated membrane-protein-associated protein n=1 Tax=Artemisia annua TaxID=35608 RepID=A0A2U1QKD7_ARTAN|nr:vesicle-associated membrane-protein-associated protein [Artemisia annua]